MDPDQSTREHVGDLMTWRSAHVEFDRVVKNVPEELRGRRPASLPYSLWELLEHIRLAQHDILDFCINPRYETLKWPDDFWPVEPEPPEREQWQHSIDTYRRDRQAMLDLVQDDEVDLHGAIPHGDGQTYLREALLAADHTAYHVGQMVLIRRILGIWPP